MAESKKPKISANTLSSKLVVIRDTTKNERMASVRAVLGQLNYGKINSISIEQFDNFLIRAICQCFGLVRSADIVLMAFGLLQGYGYNEINSIGVRRKKYLEESDYLPTHPRKQVSYADANASQRKRLEDGLRKAEDSRIHKLAEFLSEQDIETYVKKNIETIAIPVPSYILAKDTPELDLSDCEFDIALADEADDDAAEKIDTTARSKKETEEAPSKESDTAAPVDPDSEPDEHSPPGPESASKTHNPNNPNVAPNIDKSKNGFWGNTIVVISGRIPWLLLGCILTAVFFWYRPYSPANTGNEEADSETLVPGQITQIQNIIVGDDALDRVLEYISSDPDLVTVSESGLLMVREGRPGEASRNVDVTMRGESGATETKTYTVDLSQEGYDLPEDDVNDYTPSFRVEQRMRLVGTEEWLNCVEDAKPGDKIEVRIQYINISDETQRNVMIKDILPNNLRYIFGTTVLTNGSGTLPDFGQDALFTTGVNIGHYKPGINAYIDFTAEVIGNGLPEGSNTLVSWSQCCVNQVTLQDYAAVQLYM